MKNKMRILLLILLTCCTNPIPEPPGEVPEAPGEAPETPDMTWDTLLPAPVIYEISPDSACHNKDMWISLETDFVHWDAVIQIRLRTTTHHAWYWILDRDRDSCGNSIVDWEDLRMVRFRTRGDLIDWDLVAGQYLVRILNPDGKRSNVIDLDLRHCSSHYTDEIPTCN